MRRSLVGFLLVLSAVILLSPGSGPALAPESLEPLHPPPPCWPALRPVADAGNDQYAATGVPITLDGSGSYDRDGRLITFAWTLAAAPSGSAATLADPTAPNPAFTPDRPGEYRFRLTIPYACRKSRHDWVTLTVLAAGHAPPNPIVGRDQQAVVGVPVTVDGSESSDPEGAPLTFLWSFERKPRHSRLTDAAILARDTAIPSFTPDVAGRYLLTLRVSDGALTEEADVEVTVAPRRAGPNADAGPDQMLAGLGPVTLDGSGSNDPDGWPRPLRFNWSLVFRPAGSSLTTASLMNGTSAAPTFTPDVVGRYLWRLEVDDGHQWDGDNVLIEVTGGPQNQAPIATDDTPLTDEDTAVGITVLGNDNDPDGDPLAITGVTQGANGGSVAINGTTVTYTPSLNFNGADTFTYSISDGRGGTDTGTVTVTVTPVNDPPTVGLGADQTSGSPPLAVAFTATAGDVDGDLLTYAWDFGDGTTIPNGSASENHTYQSAGSFTATVIVSDGQANAQANVTITPSGGIPPDPSTVAPPLSQTSTTDLGSATAFLHTGSNPIQTGVAPGTIEPIRAAVVRGRVLDRSGTPVSGVAISILNRPEFGQTLSRTDGMFDMAVNGGGSLTVNYRRIGLLSAQRLVNVPWQDYVMAPDVVLLPFDPQVTTVDLTAPGISVARSSIMTDTDGTRRTSLLFLSGTTATMKLPNNTTQGLSVLHVRATEFTVGPNGPNAMPGDLPGNSGYTYAVDYSIDEAVAAGALEVTFSQPVIQYNENFLNFPVGTVIPSGAYNPETGQWIASDSGRVVKILAITGGTADLDLIGNDQPATDPEYAALGMTVAERQTLATLYTVNQSLWRVPVIHFTQWDSNLPFAPPPDAQPPGDNPPACDT